MKSQIRIHTENIEQNRQNDINEILTACENNNTTEIMKFANRLAENSSNYIHTSFDLEYRQVSREGPFQLLLCTGSELLLHALVILETPDKYCELSGVKKEPPSFHQLKNQAKRILLGNLDKIQRQRMTDILDLIHSKRNMFSHFSLGIHSYYYQYYEILNVIAYIFEMYFPSLSIQTDEILKMKERFKMKYAENYDFVNFS